MTKILVPVDGSDHAYKALDLACTIASTEPTELTLVYVCAPSDIIHKIPDSMNDDFGLRLGKAFKKIDLPDLIHPQNIQQSALSNITDHVNKSAAINRVIGEKTLEHAIDRAVSCGCENVEPKLLIGKPADEILAVIGPENIDKVVMGSRGLGAFNGAITGSVSQAVLHKAECTVILVK